MNIKNIFPKGLFIPELLMGTVDSITASSAQIKLFTACHSSSTFYRGGRYAKGEVGEFVIIESQINIILGRLFEVKLNSEYKNDAIAIGRIQLLGSISINTLRVTTGIESYPRLGDKIYSAPHQLIAILPDLMNEKEEKNPPIKIQIGAVNVALESKVCIKPEKLFGRHLAILGSTGGGKSWTTANILEQSLQFSSKMILIDATGEYHCMKNKSIKHVHLSNPINPANNSLPCSLSPETFQESDFIALFEPSGKVQGPKLMEAIKSLRLAKLCPETFPDGYIPKINQNKEEYINAIKKDENISKLDNPSQPFDVKNLVKQLEQECVYPTDRYKNNCWGGSDESSYSFCLPLITRINNILNSSALNCIFKNNQNNFLLQELMQFYQNSNTDNSEKFVTDINPQSTTSQENNKTEHKLLRIDLSGISFEYNAREIISNTIGRYLLNNARQGKFKHKPLLIFVDEAHNFLGKHIGGDDVIAKLDAFELIAKEGRKFSLNICFSTQRPRDITEGILSQIGTMIVHRLTNDRDRDIIERACGEIDRSASAFLPNLKPGEAVIIGSDFPIPLTVQVSIPKNEPESSGANYQDNWK